VSLAVTLVQTPKPLRNIYRQFCTLVKLGTAVSGTTGKKLECFINLFLCLVLLLDEADIFLEERTLSDLERNSLVSGNTYLYVLYSFALTTASVFTHVRIL